MALTLRSVAPFPHVGESDEDGLRSDTGHVPGAQKRDWHADLNDAVARGYVGHTWFVLTYLLGYRRVRNYDRSWTEWGNGAGLPIECEAPPAATGG